MISLINKILSDTLTNEKGKYSRKSLTMFVSFGVCVAMGFIDMFTNFKINDIVFFSFMGMSGGQTLASLYDKKISNNKEKEQIKE